MDIVRLMFMRQFFAIDRNSTAKPKKRAFDEHKPFGVRCDRFVANFFL